MPGKSKIKFDMAMEMEDDNTEEYRKRRDRNNMAVKKSRDKSKRKTEDTLNRVKALRDENSVLEEKVKFLSQQLRLLKDIFMAHAANKTDESKFEGIDLQKLLEENGDLLSETSDMPTTRERSNKRIRKK